MTMAIAGSQVYTTISEERYNLIAKQVSTLRRSGTGKLQERWAELAGRNGSTAQPVGKQELITAILDAELGWEIIPFYDEQTKRKLGKRAGKRMARLALGTQLMLV